MTRTRSYAGLIVATALALAGMLLAATSASAAFTADLAVGSSGPDVSALQTYLATDSALYPEGLVTGYFGSLTEAAVMRFQAKYGIDQAGRVGPLTRAKLGELGVGGGTSLPPNTGGDVAAPVMGAESVSVTSNSATITWSTDESARHRVMYATAFPFLYANAASVTGASMGTSASITLSGLQPNTTYYYVRESVDAAGNLSWTVKNTFTTSAQ